jgi:hypothetical protein
MNYATMQPVDYYSIFGTGLSYPPYFFSSPVLSFGYQIYATDFFPPNLVNLFQCFPTYGPKYDREGTSLAAASPAVSLPAPICGSVAVIKVMHEDESSPPANLPLFSSVTRTWTEKISRDGQYHLRIRDNGYGAPMIARSFMRAENGSAREGVSGTFGATAAGRIIQRGAPPPLIY